MKETTEVKTKTTPIKRMRIAGVLFSLIIAFFIIRFFMDIDKILKYLGAGNPIFDYLLWLFPIVGLIYGFSMIAGKCPHCGASIIAYSTNKALTCKEGKKIILIKEGKFILDD
jgi:hypothetical protein